MAIPKFYLEKRKDKDGNTIVKDVPILMYYSFGTGRLQYYTGQRIDSKNYNSGYWKTGRSPVKPTSPGGANINNFLDMLATEVVNAHNQARMSGTPVTAAFFREVLDEKFKPKLQPESIDHDLMSYMQLIVDERKSGKRVVLSGKRAGNPFKQNAIKNLQTTLSILKRFVGHEKIRSIPREIAFKILGLDFCFVF